jgi:hypothetical protein
MDKIVILKTVYRKPPKHIVLRRFFIFFPSRPILKARKKQAWRRLSPSLRPVVTENL